MLWDQELQSLEAAIGRLNAEYDVFLYGSASKPPVKARKDVEQTIRRLSTRDPEVAAVRYRFTTLQGRFNALCERWDRLQAEKESGKRPGVYGGFARESGRSAPATPAAPPPNAPVSSSVQQPGAGTDPDADLFERYLAARRSRGENVAGFDLAHFRESLARERGKLKERFGEVNVDFDVTEREGRVKLVARRRSAATEETPDGESKENP